jgi:hypothetical protein
MQVKYHGCSTVMEYCREMKAGALVFPRTPGYRSQGYYSRYAVDENGVKQRIAIRRERSKKPTKGSSSCISRLPKMLCPYHKHPVTMMSRIMGLWCRGRRGMDAVIDEVSRVYDRKSAEVEHDLIDLTRAQLRGMKAIYEGALRKYRIWRDLTQDYGLDQFVALCARDGYTRVLDIDARYYEANGGRFLFGNASWPRPARAPVPSG